MELISAEMSKGGLKGSEVVSALFACMTWLNYSLWVSLTHVLFKLNPEQIARIL